MRNLVRRVGLQATYQKPRTTVPGDPSKTFPCMVNLTQIRAVEQVWATDMSNIPLQKGSLYQVAIVALFSRNVLSWKLFNSLVTEFSLQTLEMTLSSARKHEIFHTVQGYQLTSTDFVSRLLAEIIKVSWSGRKRGYASMLVERFWHTVKYYEVYMHVYSDG